MEQETKQMISIGLILLFAFAAIFMLGYYFAYNKSVRFANEKILEAEKNCDFMRAINNEADFKIPNMVIADE